MKLFSFRKVEKAVANFAKGYYNLLLIFLTLLFIVRPYAKDYTYLSVWKVILVGTLFTSIFNANSHRIVKWITSILMIPLLILGWRSLHREWDFYFIGSVVCTILFISITAGAILYDVVIRARVTLETLRGVICAYFMLAFGFAYAYYLIIFLNPDAFSFHPGEIVPNEPRTMYLAELIYFSFVTLLTIGYGDIVAVSDMAQTAAVLEGIIGQFYVAILVARLVSVYTFYGDRELVRLLRDKNSPQKK